MAQLRDARGDHNFLDRGRLSRRLDGFRSALDRRLQLPFDISLSITGTLDHGRCHMNECMNPLYGFIVGARNIEFGDDSDFEAVVTELRVELAPGFALCDVADGASNDIAFAKESKGDIAADVAVCRVFCVSGRCPANARN